LPLVPFDPKLLAYPHPQDRLYAYSECSLLKEYKHELIHPEGEQGLPCTAATLVALARAVTHPDGLLLDFYLLEKLLPRKDLLDPKDLPLLAKPVEKKVEQKEVPNVPWLRRTEYISQDKSTFGRRAQSIEYPEIVNHVEWECRSETNRKSKICFILQWMSISIELRNHFRQRSRLI
jgi:RNA polymerase II-associated factor 1